MSGLIPLKLQPTGPAVKHPPQPGPPPSKPLPPLPTESGRRPNKEMLSIQVPRTKKDWRRSLDEVRTLYLKRLYKQCLAKCMDLLEEVKNGVVPLHRIYLSFYAATCLELTARPLPIASPQKLHHIELARFHYQDAQQYMWKANLEHLRHVEHINEKPYKNHERLISSSSETSTVSFRSSTGSVAESVFSQVCSTPVPSPASSTFSFSSKEDPLKPSPLCLKKRVSFQSSPMSAVSPGQNCSHSGTKTSKFPPQHNSSEREIAPSQNQKKPDTMSSFLLSRSLARYHAHLNSLDTQLTHHIFVLDSLIAEINIHNAQHRLRLMKATSDLSRLSQPGNHPSTLGGTCLDRREESGAEKESEHERRLRMRRERIAELKMRGAEWKMGRGSRFDGRRYEQLCDQALKEAVEGKE